jgi:hypothetical protein
MDSPVDKPLKLEEYKRKILSFLHSEKLCVLLGISCMHYTAHNPQRFSASMSYARETGRFAARGQRPNYVLARMRHREIFLVLLSTRVVFWGGGGVVVKALRYKPAGRGFDSRWCHWNFSVT